MFYLFLFAAADLEEGENEASILQEDDTNLLMYFRFFYVGFLLVCYFVFLYLVFFFLLHLKMYNQMMKLNHKRTAKTAKPLINLSVNLQK